MEYGNFIMSGEDKSTLASIKSMLVSNNHIFIGYTKQSANILRHIRSCNPDFVIIEITPGSFFELKPILRVIDEDLLAACILLIEYINDEIYEFIKASRVMTYMLKPVHEAMVIQTVDLSLLNLRRVQEYENRVKKLNDTLESRKIIEKAKWILVEKDGFSEAEAYEIIKKKSRDSRMPMREIAEAIILTRG